MAATVEYRSFGNKKLSKDEYIDLCNARMRVIQSCFLKIQHAVMSASVYERLAAADDNLWSAIVASMDKSVDLMDQAARIEVKKSRARVRESVLQVKVK